MKRLGRTLTKLTLIVACLSLVVVATQCKRAKDQEGNGDVLFHDDGDGRPSNPASVEFDESELADVGVEEILGQFAIEGYYVLPHPEDWSGFAVYPGAKEGLAIYPALLEPEDPAYESAKVALNRLLRHKKEHDISYDESDFFDAEGNILMDNLSEGEQRAINKYMEVVMYETVEAAHQAPQTYAGLFQMIGESIAPDSVYVYRNYTLFNMNHWAPEKAERFRKILREFVDEEMKREDPAAHAAKNVPDLSEAVVIDPPSGVQPEKDEKEAEAN